MEEITKEVLEVRVNDAIDILNIIKREIPRSMGDININLIYEDICKAINKLEGKWWNIY